MDKMKNFVRGIGGKLTLSVILLMSLSVGAIAFFTFMSSSKALQSQVEESLVVQANDVANYVDVYFERVFDDLKAIAEREEIQGMDQDVQMNYLQERLAKTKEYQTFAIVRENGLATFLEGDELDLNERTYIQDGFAGKTAVSDVLTSLLTGEPAIIAVTPIQTVTGENALLLVHIDGYFLSDVTEDIKVGENGFALILSSDGTMMGHKNREWVKEHINFINEAATNGTFIGEGGALRDTVVPNESGIATYTSSSGGQRYIGFATLNTGWKVGVVALEEEFLAALQDMKQTVFIATAIILLLATIVTYIISQTIARPIVGIAKVSETLASGDFTQDVNARYKNRKDEIGILANSLQNMKDNTQQLMHEVTAGAMQVEAATMSMGLGVDEMQSMTNNIVSAVSEVSSGAMAQATMAEESSQSMEQMSQGIQNVAEVASTIVGNVDFIQQKMEEGKQAVQNSVNQMHSIQDGTEKELAIIQHLEKESLEIGQISKMITDIADQTNLLALNASIEAARAGEAGKGFAVVADEVRKLSEQTATSASQINHLISNVQSYTKEAVQAAQGGAQNIVTGISTIEQVGNRFNEVADAITKITVEIEQMSAAAEQMSANTEEVSAAMEEMAATARTANNYVQDVTIAIQNQQQTVTNINNETEKLEEMASHLKQSVQNFKI